MNPGPLGVSSALAQQHIAEMRRDASQRRLVRSIRKDKGEHHRRRHTAVRPQRAPVT